MQLHALRLASRVQRLVLVARPSRDHDFDEIETDAAYLPCLLNAYSDVPPQPYPFTTPECHLKRK